MKNTIDILNKEFAKQDFSKDKAYDSATAELINTAYNYAKIENAIAVLSDLRAKVSYIFYGKFSHIFGLGRDVSEMTMASIWEEDIFSRIHPDDLADKHLHELCFLHFIKQQPRKKRADYYLMSKLRMRTTTNSYIPVIHRMFYIFGTSGETLHMALCLYSPMVIDFSERCVIIDSSGGHTIQPEAQNKDNILSTREKHILSLIDKGLTSKDIAEMLHISINTVSRHRQDILSKLQVRNSIEACRIAKELKII